MTTRKFGRTALIAVLALSIVMSITGGTIAWFTDEVTSAGNVIEAGTLDVKLYYSADASAWIDVEDKNAENAMFSYDKWEPGYTAVKYVKVENAGNLAVKYQLDVNSDSIIYSGASDLSEVIDVYAVKAATVLGKADILTDANKVGTLKELKAEKAFFNGELLAKTESDPAFPADTLCIALHMQEAAGNEYQNCSLSNIAIKLLATQDTVEIDGFNDNKYDADATFPENVDPSVPKAEVSMIDSADYAEFTPVNADRIETVDVGYTFIAPDDENTVDDNIYKEWHADFTISFDKPVKAGIIGLAGQYEAYQEDWLGFDIDQDIINAALKRKDSNSTDPLPANTPVRMLGTAGINFNYDMICSIVKEFNCGTYAVNNEANGITATVELRLYEPATDANNANAEEETGRYIVIGAFPYTFEYVE